MTPMPPRIPRLRPRIGLLPLTALLLLVGNAFAQSAGQRDFDVTSIDAYGAFDQSAEGTSNGVNWKICGTYFSSCCGANTNDGYTGFNNANFSPPVAGEDVMHLGGQDFTVLFDRPVGDLVFYLRENGGIASFDFGLTPTPISGAANLNIVGTRIFPNTAGGAVRFENVGYSITGERGAFDGMNLAFYVESASSGPTVPLVCPGECADLDNDGVTDCDGDCDDTDPTIFPGNTESCNGIDDNCDGVIEPPVCVCDDISNATIIGTEGNDYLLGHEGDDVIFGLGGDDIILGKGGNDILCGGAGMDSLSGGAGDDVIGGGSGYNWMFGDAGDDLLYGGDDGNEMQGNDGNDDLAGGAGPDTMYGGNDHDILMGGAGDDDMLGNDGDDQLHGEAGMDWMLGGNGNDCLDGGADNDTLKGEGGDDCLSGGDGIDQAVCSAGNDTYSSSNEWDFSGCESAGVCMCQAM